MSSQDAAHEQEQSEQAFSVDRLQKDFMTPLSQATKLARGFPGDFMALRSHEEFNRCIVNEGGKRILKLLSSMRDAAVPNKSQAMESSELEDAVDDGERFNAVVDLADVLLDRVDALLDPAGREAVEAFVKSSSVPSSTLSRKKAPLMQAVMNKPQLRFMDSIDNSEAAFLPRVPPKVHTLDPSFRASAKRAPPRGDNAGWEHPYAWEVYNVDYTEDMLQADVEPSPPPKIEQTPLEWVDTVEQLQDLADLLSKQNAFAVDLEHHSYRSYLGFVCLMQISTKNADYVIDTLELREHMHVLTPSFTDPRIVKIFHGAEHDVQWMQRDFGLFVVNMFDTYHAAKVLGLKQLSLAYLLQEYCHITADKRYQMADWRIRPLTAEMILYARMDTHFLLYIYEVLKRQLVEKCGGKSNLIETVFSHSADVCMIRYSKPVFDPEGYQQLLARQHRHLNPREQQILATIWRWRDQVARQEDESVNYVLNQFAMLMLAEKPPSDRAQLIAKLNNSASACLRNRADDLLSAIKRAKEDIQASPQEGDSHMQMTPRQAHTSTPRMSPGYIGSEVSSAHSGGGPGSSPLPTSDQLFSQAGWVKTGWRGKEISNSISLKAKSTPTPPPVTGHSITMPPLQEEDNAGSSAAQSAVGIFGGKQFTLEDGIDKATAKALQEVQQSLVASTPLSVHKACPSPVAPSPTQMAANLRPKEAAEKLVLKKSEADPSSSAADIEMHIPQTMAEIYALSNVNRRRNRDKRVGNEGGTVATTSTANSDRQAADIAKSSSVARQSLDQLPGEEDVLRNAGYSSQTPEGSNFDYYSAAANVLQRTLEQDPVVFDVHSAANGDVGKRRGQGSKGGRSATSLRAGNKTGHFGGRGGRPDKANYSSAPSGTRMQGGGRTSWPRK